MTKCGRTVNLVWKGERLVKVAVVSPEQHFTVCLISAVADDWPDRRNRTPEQMVKDLVQ